MRLLLDTHVLLWWLGNDPGLSEPVRQAVSALTSEVFVSAATVWEIAIKKALGKLDCPEDLLEQVERHRFRDLPVTASHALAAGALPRHHDDPFDRMLIAQAQVEELVFVTRDVSVRAYDIAMLEA